MASYRRGLQSDAHEFLLSILRQLECDAGYVCDVCNLSDYALLYNPIIYGHPV